MEFHSEYEGRQMGRTRSGYTYHVTSWVVLILTTVELYGLGQVYEGDVVVDEEGVVALVFEDLGGGDLHPACNMYCTVLYYSVLYCTCPPPRPPSRCARPASAPRCSPRPRSGPQSSPTRPRSGSRRRTTVTTQIFLYSE